MRKLIRAVVFLLLVGMLPLLATYSTCGHSVDSAAGMRIIEPMTGQSFKELQEIRFRAEGTDEAGLKIPENSFRWTSSSDGFIGIGNAFDTDSLSVGRHMITLNVAGIDGLELEAQIFIDISAAEGIQIIDNGYLGLDYFSGDPCFVQFALRDSKGRNISGLTADDIVITRSLVDEAGRNIANLQGLDIRSQIEGGSSTSGIWESNSCYPKLDIVFLVEHRHELKEDMYHIENQFYAFIDRLKEGGVDFRVAGAGFEVGPGVDPVVEFHGDEDIAALKQDFKMLFSTSQGWFSPSSSYDALMWVPWLGFRDDARKIVVIITGTPPQTVFGTYWYAYNNSMATDSAVKSFLDRNPDIEVYYCLNPKRNSEYEFYYDRAVNPMAGDGLDERGLGSGFGALEEKGIIKGLRAAPDKDAWPFDQSLIPVPQAVNSRSVYSVAWESGLNRDEVLKVLGPGESDLGKDLKIMHTIGIRVPGEKDLLLASWYDPLTSQKAELSVQFFDEAGNPHNDCWSYLYYLAGDKLFLAQWQLSGKEGSMSHSATPGNYLLVTSDGGTHGFAYTSLRAIDRRRIEVPASGLSIEVRLQTSEKELDLALARGLINSIGGWRQPGDPFKLFLPKAISWVNGLEQGGLTWEEQVKLRRFAISLSGYANMSEYAQMEIEYSTENVKEILEDFQSIIQEVLDLADSTKFKWEDALGIILEAGYDIITKGEFTINKITIEECVQELIKYASEELLTDLKNLVCTTLKDRDYQNLICTLVSTGADLVKALKSDEFDLSAIMEPLKKLAIDIALDQAREFIAENFVDAVFSGISLDSKIEADLVFLVKDIIRAVTSSSEFDSFDKTLTKFAKDVVTHLGEQFYRNNREDMVEVIKGLFEKVKAEADENLEGVEGSGFIRDFLIGLGEDMALAVLPRVKDDGKVDYSFDSDAIVKVLIKHTLHHIFLKNFFSDDVARSLNLTLESASGFRQEETSRSYTSNYMRSDFYSYRNRVDELQDVAWNALKSQKAINNWAEALDGLTEILKPLEAALDFMAKIYPPMQDTADAVAGFINVLDGIQIASTAVELALRVDSLDRFGQESVNLYLLAYGSQN